MQLDQIENDVIDVPGLMAHIDSDVSILTELVEIFDSYYPEQISQLREAIDSNDCSEIREIAHQFKGAVSNFYGSAAVEVARDIEDAGRDGRLEDAKSRFDNLEQEIDRLVENLKKLAASA